MHKWSQANLAERPSLSINHVSSIERAKADVTLHTLIAIAQALEVDLETLVASCKKKHADFIKEIVQETQYNITLLLDEDVLAVHKWTNLLVQQKEKQRTHR